MAITLVPLTVIAIDRIESLLDSAFGADRRSRTAYQIRAGADFEPALSFAALDDEQLVGLIQCWPVRLTLDRGGTTPMLMVGPVAVAPNRQRDGIGRMLMTEMLAAASTQGRDRALMLIGDPEYYGRFFGFTADCTGLWRVPGPVEQHRLLARGPDVVADAGLVGPRIAASA